MSFIENPTKNLITKLKILEKFSRIFLSKKSMMDNNTPDKLREIIMDTWPQLYWLKNSKDNKNGRKHTNTTKNKGVV
jgi:hypothetical protein